LVPAQKNAILAMLDPGDLALLEPHLEHLDLPVRRQLEIRNRRIEHVYFMENGLASMVVSAGAGQNIEVGIIGHEGMTGLPIIHECDRAWHETFVQSAGSAQRLKAAQLRDAMEKSLSLRRVLLRHANVLVSQMAYTALANGRYKVEERLARWLLMADDRAHGEPINLTHEFLALMLGSRRASVTNALADFQRQETVRVRRGIITVVNRRQLEEAANGSYGVPEAEYQRLFGNEA
jgi:CRP-like cAMP-binding protein